MSVSLDTKALARAVRKYCGLPENKDEVTVRTQEEGAEVTPFKANRLLLALSSRFFESWMKKHPSSNEITLTDESVTSRGLGLVLDFFRTGKYPIEAGDDEAKAEFFRALAALKVRFTELSASEENSSSEADTDVEEIEDDVEMPEVSSPEERASQLLKEVSDAATKVLKEIPSGPVTAEAVKEVVTELTREVSEVLKGVEKHLSESMEPLVCEEDIVEEESDDGPEDISTSDMDLTCEAEERLTEKTSPSDKADEGFSELTSIREGDKSVEEEEEAAPEEGASSEPAEEEESSESAESTGKTSSKPAEEEESPADLAEVTSEPADERESTPMPSEEPESEPMESLRCDELDLTETLAPELEAPITRLPSTPEAAADKGEDIFAVATAPISTESTGEKECEISASEPGITTEAEAAESEPSSAVGDSVSVSPPRGADDEAEDPEDAPSPMDTDRAERKEDDTVTPKRKVVRKKKTVTVIDKTSLKTRSSTGTPLKRVRSSLDDELTYVKPHVYGGINCRRAARNISTMLKTSRKPKWMYVAAAKESKRPSLPLKKRPRRSVHSAGSDDGYSTNDDYSDDEADFEITPLAPLPTPKKADEATTPAADSASDAEMSVDGGDDRSASEAEDVTPKRVSVKKTPKKAASSTPSLSSPVTRSMASKMRPIRHRRRSSEGERGLRFISRTMGICRDLWECDKCGYWQYTVSSVRRHQVSKHLMRLA